MTELKLAKGVAVVFYSHMNPCRWTVAVLMLATALCGAAPQLPPNVILILADDLGWTDLACYGSELYETPNLDRLAREGMKFTQAYSACTVCSPTRASI